MKAPDKEWPVVVVVRWLILLAGFVAAFRVEAGGGMVWVAVGAVSVVALTSMYVWKYTWQGSEGRQADAANESEEEKDEDAAVVMKMINLETEELDFPRYMEDNPPRSVQVFLSYARSKQPQSSAKVSIPTAPRSVRLMEKKLTKEVEPFETVH